MAVHQVQYCSPVAGSWVNADYDDVTHLISNSTVLGVPCSLPIPESPLYSHEDGGTVYKVWPLNAAPWFQVESSTPPPASGGTPLTGQLEWALRFYDRIISNGADQVFNFWIYRKVGTSFDEPFFSLPLQGVNAIFSNEIPGAPNEALETPKMESDVDLGVSVGGSIVIMDAATNNGRKFFVASYENQGGGYPHVYRFTQDMGWSFNAETDTSGFTVWIDPSEPVIMGNMTTQIGDQNTLDGDDLTPRYEPVLQGETVLDLKSSTGEEYDEIFTNDPAIFKLVITLGATNFIEEEAEWIGFSLPEEHNAQMWPGHYYQQVKFVCGLNLARRRRYYIADPDPDTTLLEILQSALAEGTRLSLPLRENVNVYRSIHNEGEDDSPLTQTSIKPKRYYKPGAKMIEPIEEVCKQFGAQLFQYGGEWILQRQDELSGEYVSRQYDAAGAFLQSQWLNVAPKEIYDTHGERESNWFAIAPAAKRLALKFDSSFINAEGDTNRIPNGYLEDWPGSLPVGWTLNAGNTVHGPFTAVKSSNAQTGRNSVLVTGSASPVNYLQVTATNTQTGEIMATVMPQGAGLTMDNTPLLGWSVERNGYFYNANTDLWEVVGPSPVVNPWADEVIVISGARKWYDYKATFNPSNNHPTGEAGDSIVRVHPGIGLTPADQSLLIDRVEIRDAAVDYFDPRDHSLEYAVGGVAEPLDERNGSFDIEPVSPLDDWVFWHRRGVTEAVPLYQVNADSIFEEVSGQQRILFVENWRAAWPDLRQAVIYRARRYKFNGMQYRYKPGTLRAQFVEIKSIPKYEQ